MIAVEWLVDDECDSSCPSTTAVVRWVGRESKSKKLYAQSRLTQQSLAAFLLLPVASEWRPPRVGCLHEQSQLPRQLPAVELFVLTGPTERPPPAAKYHKY